jgi:hypothetical protein
VQLLVRRRLAKRFLGRFAKVWPNELGHSKLRSVLKQAGGNRVLPITASIYHEINDVTELFDRAVWRSSEIPLNNRRQPRDDLVVALDRFVLEFGKERREKRNEALKQLRRRIDGSHDA